jgi:hypothetical protein
MDEEVMSVDMGGEAGSKDEEPHDLGADNSTEDDTDDEDDVAEETGICRFFDDFTTAEKVLTGVAIGSLGTAALIGLASFIFGRRK